MLKYIKSSASIMHNLILNIMHSRILCLLGFIYKFLLDMYIFIKLNMLK